VRTDDRFAQGQYRDPRSEFGSRHEPDDRRRGSYELSAYGSTPASSRWREFGGDRLYGPGEPYSGGAPYGGRDEEDDRGGWRRDASQHGGRTAWQPARHSVIDPRRWQYGVYRPRYGGSSVGPGYGSSYGAERAEDCYGRQGYGQGAWQEEHEHEQHRFDPDYLQWRAEQIRELDNDYQRYRQERYKKFCEEFGSWHKNRERRPRSRTANQVWEPPTKALRATRTLLRAIHREAREATSSRSTAGGGARH
jgi:hypothetical protein